MYLFRSSRTKVNRLVHVCHSSTSPFKYNMNIAYLRNEQDESDIRIIFHYQCEKLRIDREFNLKRSVNELVDTSLDRMKTNIVKEVQKRSKKKKNDCQPEQSGVNVDDISLSIIRDNGESIQGISWADLYTKSAEPTPNAVLKIYNNSFVLAYNYPYVSRLVLPSFVMVGYSCYPAKFDLHGTTKEECIFKWYKGLPSEKENDIEWTQCGESFIYEVKLEDLGHKLKVTALRYNIENSFISMYSMK